MYLDHAFMPGKGTIDPIFMTSSSAKCSKRFWKEMENDIGHLRIWRRHL